VSGTSRYRVNGKVSVKLSGENGLGYEEKERKIFRI
jgi:hypothetical protein